MPDERNKHKTRSTARLVCICCVFCIDAPSGSSRCSGQQPVGVSMNSIISDFVYHVCQTRLECRQMFNGCLEGNSVLRGCKQVV